MLEYSDDQHASAVSIVTLGACGVPTVCHRLFIIPTVSGKLRRRPWRQDRRTRRENGGGGEGEGQGGNRRVEGGRGRRTLWQIVTLVVLALVGVGGMCEIARFGSHQ